MSEKMMFGEKATESYGEKGTWKDLPVSVTPKYRESRKAAIKLMEDKPYIEEGDFWILMRPNAGKTKMLYLGLIMTHNACLKINDNFRDSADKFKPECVTRETAYALNANVPTLVFTYNCPEQGMYEIGEANTNNCKNDYPFAMAFKRLFDRVVLKMCKIAYYGVYSDSEADEFLAAMPALKEEEPVKAAPKKETPAPTPESGLCEGGELCGEGMPGATEEKPLVTEEMAKTIVDAATKTKVDLSELMVGFGVEKVENLTVEQGKSIMRRLIAIEKRNKAAEGK